MEYGSECYNGRPITPFTMRLEGRGSVKGAPDVAVVQIGIETHNENLQVAQEENTIKTRRVIDTLKEMGVRQQDIKTMSYTINKEYDYVDGKSIEKGYEVRNILEVTIRDIGSIGKIIDGAVDSGANIVQSIDFQISNPSMYYRYALNLALEDAREKAQVLGRRMGVRVSHVPIQVIEESYSQGPVAEPYYSVQAESTTPIEAGQNEVTARITGVFSYY